MYKNSAIEAFFGEGYDGATETFKAPYAQFKKEKLNLHIIKDA